MYGKEFLKSYNCTIILFVGCLSMIIYKLIHPIYISKGKQKIVLKILILAIIVNVILNCILIPKFDMFGASFSSVVSYSVCSILLLIEFCKEYEVKITDFFIIKKEECDFIKHKLLKKRGKIKNE